MTTAAPTSDILDPTRAASLVRRGSALDHEAGGSGFFSVSHPRHESNPEIPRPAAPPGAAGNYVAGVA